MSADDKTAVTEFNKSAVFNKDIQEKLHELKALCKKEGIPFFFSACVKNEKGKSVYENDMLSPEVCGEKLFLDNIAKYCNVSIGFDTVPPSSVIEMDADVMF